MAISVLTNVPSLFAQKNLAKTQSSLQSSIGKLSSGLRINNAADDAAGLGISENLKPTSAACRRPSATPTTASRSRRSPKAR
jgi:flagellin-like hook-associated protein FlgL